MTGIPPKPGRSLSPADIRRRIRMIEAQQRELVRALSKLQSQCPHSDLLGESFGARIRFHCPDCGKVWEEAEALQRNRTVIRVTDQGYSWTPTSKKEKF